VFRDAGGLRRHSLVLVFLFGCAGAPDLAQAPPATLPPPASPPAATGTAPTASAPSEVSSGGAPPQAPAAKSPETNDTPAAIDEENVYAGAHTAAALVPLLDDAGHPLPQTDTRPSTKTQTFEPRMRLLAHAIASGDFDSALPAFFPAVAYAQVKDIPQPEKDWRARLVAAFKRDLAEYRKKLGPDAAKAILVGLDVPEASARFMKPGSEGNRIGYYRVLRSKLVFRVPSGEEQSFAVTSMISWRGEWYVVHLKGFK
jgi:hypothetical protein